MPAYEEIADRLEVVRSELSEMLRRADDDGMPLPSTLVDQLAALVVQLVALINALSDLLASRAR